MILNRKTRILYFGVLAVFFVVGLVYFKDILLPLAYSYVFAVFVFPFYQWLSYKRCPKALNVALAACFFLVVSVAMIYLFAFAAQGWIEFLESRREQLLSVREVFYNLLEEIRLKEKFVGEQGMERVLGVLQSFSFSVVNYLALFALSFIFYVFILIAPDRTLRKSLNYKNVGPELRKYLKYKFLFSLATAVFVSFVLASFKIQHWRSVAIFVFILNFVPNIGSIAATILPLPMFYLQYGFGPEFWFLLAATSLIQFALGNMIEPRVMGKVVDTPAIVVVVALLFWGKVWGALGVFFAVPSLIALSRLYPRIKRYLE